MKKIITLLILFSIGAFTFNSCDTTELDLTENPNALSPDQASPDFLLNGIQENFARLVESFGRTGAEVTRIDYMLGRQYRSAYNPGDFSEEWEDAYAEILNDISFVYNLGDAQNIQHHIGISQFIEAYTITMLVDFFGDIPYSEALQGLENLNPKTDDGADIYNQAIALLDQAIINFNVSDVDKNPENDFFYNNNYDKWVKAANSLKMRLLMQKRLADPNAVGQFMTLKNAGNYITSSEDDLTFQWGTNEVQPDTRHPRYIDSYTTTGGGDYMSNWLMNYMDTNDDPRIQYYYYRQTNSVPGADGADPSEELLNCSLQTAPVHYAGFTFCYLSNGYWGRDHGDTAGTPPDGFFRTIAGVYPAGGSFDDRSFDSKVQGDGGGGNGITPIILSSTMDFLIAEAEMLTDPSAGKASLIAALEKSVAKVMTFGSKDSGADLSTAPTNADVNSHKEMIDMKFTNGTNMDKWNILAEEFFTSLYGNGIDAYNFYRRTGYPSTLQPNIEPSPGAFIRSFFYPSNFANNNSSVSQKPDHVQQVFWDSNPATGFPLSN